MLSTYTIFDSPVASSPPVSTSSEFVINTPLGNQQLVSFNTDSGSSTTDTSTSPLTTTAVPDLSVVDAQAQTVTSIPLATTSPSNVMNSSPSSILSAPSSIAFESATPTPTILASGQQAITTLASDAFHLSYISTNTLILVGLTMMIAL